jgi:hypothetical protein
MARSGRRMEVSKMKKERDNGKRKGGRPHHREINMLRRDDSDRGEKGGQVCSGIGSQRPRLREIQAQRQTQRWTKASQTGRKPRNPRKREAHARTHTLSDTDTHTFTHDHTHYHTQNTQQ